MDIYANVASHNIFGTLSAYARLNQLNTPSLFSNLENTMEICPEKQKKLITVFLGDNGTSDIFHERGRVSRNKSIVFQPFLLTIRGKTLGIGSSFYGVDHKSSKKNHPQFLWGPNYTEFCCIMFYCQAKPSPSSSSAGWL